MKNKNSSNKFNARKVEYDGYVFDSKKEFKRYLELKNMQKQGRIKSYIVVHPEYVIIDESDKFKKATYKGDFLYENLSGNKVLEDVKGLRKGSAYSLFKIKQKLMYDRYGILIEEI